MPADQEARGAAARRPCGSVAEIRVGSADDPVTAPYRLGPDVVVLVVDDGTARIVDLGGEHWAISETATAMLLGALGDGVDSTCQAIAAAAGAPVDRVRDDAMALLRDLGATGVLLSDGQGPADDSLRDRTAETVGRAALRWCLARDRGTAGTAGWLMALAWAATRTVGWASTVRWWRQEVEAASRAAAGPGGEQSGQLDAVTAVTSRALAGLPLPVACKERALCAYTLTRRAGLPARIVLGVSVFPFTIHVWCESADSVVGDRREDGCDRFAPVLIYHGTSPPRPAAKVSDG